MQRTRCSAPRKRTRMQHSSPFRALDNDCLDMVATRLLGDLVSRPLESIHNFLAFCCTTEWKPSGVLYMKIIEAFTIPGKSKPNMLIDKTALHRGVKRPHKDPLQATVSVLHDMLQTLKPFHHPFQQLPCTMDDWKHAYVFFKQWRKTNSNDTGVFDAAVVCETALQDADQSILKQCNRAVTRLARFNSRDHVRESVENDPFLVSRCRTSLLQNKFTRLWSDIEGAANPMLLELLHHDADFLRTYDSLGNPTSHAVFRIGVSCKNTFEYVVQHPSFAAVLHDRSLLSDNTIAHSLSTVLLPTEHLVGLSSSVLSSIFESKKYMANRIFALYNPDRELFCRVNKENLQPWQLAGRMVAELVDRATVPTLNGAAKANMLSVIDQMIEVSAVLRMSASE